MYSCFFHQIALANILLHIFKIFSKLSKVTDVFAQFLIFPANWSVKIKTSKGEGGKADFKVIKFRFSSIIINYPFSKNVFNSNIINKQCSSCFRRCHKSDMPLMACRHASFFTVLFFISRLFRDNASQQCGTGGDLYSIYQMMFKGHTYKTFKTAPGTRWCQMSKLQRRYVHCNMRVKQPN